MEWHTLQSRVHGLNINEFVNAEFLDSIRNDFEDKDVDVIALQIAIRDKVKDPKNDDAKLDTILLVNRNLEDTLLNYTIVDVTSEEQYPKIKNIIEKYME